MKILLVEDVEGKANSIIACIKEEFPECEVVTRSSYHSAAKEIFLHHQDYQMILLDMSMSTYDKNIEELGGVPEAMAGKRILEGMFLREIETKVVVVTMYDRFGGEKLNELDKEFQKEYADFYRGYVFFSFNKADWQRVLIGKIRQLV
ncbi:MAG: hypothetical protein K6A94_05475 [Bacteroidales bacterium]|nr:hypothetical protein [Bacteroidales bacterium]